MWLPIAFLSYFFTAFSNIADKFLLSRVLKAPIVYAFYIALLGGVSVVLIPFGVKVLNPLDFFIAFFSGLFFVSGLTSMFYGFLYGDTTRIATIVGGSQPIYTFLIAFVVLSERLNNVQIFAFLVLIIGLILISYQPGAKVSQQGLKFGLLAGLFFATSYVMQKLLFNHTDIINGIFWARISSLICAVLVLVYKPWRTDILTTSKEPGSGKNQLLVLGVQFVGAIGFILLNLAISLGSVTIVNAMQGIQYAIIFIATLSLGKKFPELSEKYTITTLVRKTIAIFVIAAGLAVLASSGISLN